MTRAEYEDALIKNIVEKISQSPESKYISSVVLTGSMGRGEGTYTEKDGKLILKSDVETALVFDRDQKAVYEMINRLKPLFTEDVNFMTIHKTRVEKMYNFNYSFVTPKYKTIFMFDFFNGSKTIYGRDYISEKNIAVTDIDPYEAKRIVANRIAEMTYLAAENEYTVFQWKCKTVLAVASAWLVCEKKYRPSYFSQRDIIKDNKEEFSRIFTEEFAELYFRAFSFLREGAAEFEFDENVLRRAVSLFSDYYQTKNNERSRTTNTARKLKYILKYIKKYKKFDVSDLEDRVLSDLIGDYCRKSDDIIRTADIWHSCIY